MSERVDPFKAEAKKYARAGWGTNAKSSVDESVESGKKSEKKIKKFKGSTDVEILVSEKD